MNGGYRALRAHRPPARRRLNVATGRAVGARFGELPRDGRGLPDVSRLGHEQRDLGACERGALDQNVVEPAQLPQGSTRLKVHASKWCRGTVGFRIIVAAAVDVVQRISQTVVPDEFDAVGYRRVHLTAPAGRGLAGGEGHYVHDERAARCGHAVRVRCGVIPHPGRKLVVEE